MKLASVSLEGKATYGLIEDDAFVNVGAVLHERYPDLKSVLVAQAYTAAAAAVPEAARYAIGSVTFLPVIPNPDKILCVGLNYEMHRQETEREVVQHPTIFVRFANSQIGHGGGLVRPALSEKFDFEGEFAVIMGAPAWRVSPEQAMAHVAGFSCYNDGSVRDWQQHTHQYTPGKNFLGTGAFGPWMVTADEFGTIGSQRLTTRLSGEVVQHVRLEEMLFDVPRIISYCSSFTRLEPGDVIATGTPGGVGARRKPPLWMKPGDTAEVEIEGIGILRNPVVAEV